jgi:hypothetical protein
LAAGQVRSAHHASGGNGDIRPQVIINRQHWVWATFVILATALSALVYVSEFHPERAPLRIPLPAEWHRDVQETGRSVGGTPLGLAFGGISAAIFIFAALLGLRRKRPTLKVGRLQTWLKGHIWLSLLTIPLVALHAGFSTGSPMTQGLLVVYTIVMVSGFFGLALQHFLPRLMKERVPLETIFEQIPHILNQFREAAQEMRKGLEAVAAPALAASAAPAGAAAEVALAEPPAAIIETAPDPSEQMLRQFIDEVALPYLAAPRGEKLVLGAQRVSDDQFRLLKISVGPEWQGRVEQLQSWCDERRQLDLQTKIQHWLHGWLLVHVPFSILLLLFTLWHAVAALFFY